MPITAITVTSTASRLDLPNRDDSRSAIEELDELDPVTQDMIIGDAQKLELFHWFVRAHLEDPSGRLSNTDGSTPRG